MADYQRIVEYIRDIRTAPPGMVTDELRQYAQQYAELCVQANERLRRCSGFLQQGLRAEAIHLSEEAPNLLDLVAALDLAEPEAWAEFCRNMDLPVPPPLQMERAAQLNDAYAAEQPLEALFDEHRLLALARGPVKKRLEVLRKIAAMDPTSGFWEKDLRVFEKARLRELPAAFLAAVKNRDYEAIAELYGETHDSPWLEPLPADLSAGVNEAFGRMRRAHVEGELRRQLETLRAAYESRDLVQCVALLKQWKETMDVAGLENLSADLAREVEPITAWVKDQGQQQQQEKTLAVAVRALTDRLNADAPDAELEAAYQRVKKLGPAPADLQQRYDENRENRLLARGRRYRVRLMVVGSIFAGIILIAGGGALLYLHAQGAASWAGQIRAAVAAKDMARAEKLLEDQRTQAPQLSGAAAIKVAASDVAALKLAYQADSQRLHAMIAALTPEVERAEQAASAPDATALSLFRAANRASDAMNANNPGNDLAWVDHDGALDAVRIKLAAARDALQQAAASAVKVQADGLSAQLNNLAGGDRGDLAAQLGVLAGKARQLAALPGMDDISKQTAADVLGKIEEKQKGLVESQSEQADYADLANHADSATGLIKALSDFIARYPNSARAPDFKVALELARAGRGVEAWRDMVLRWKDGFVPASATVAQQRLTEVQAYLAANSSSPMFGAGSDYAGYLTHANEALAEKGAWQAAFADLLEKPMITDLSYMETSDHVKYLVLGSLNRTDRRINDQVTVSFDVLDPSNFAKRRTVDVDPPVTLLTEKPLPVPHARMAQAIASEVKLIDEKNWDTYGIDLSERLAKATDADVVVRAMFLQVALRTQQQLTPLIGDLYDRTLRDLARQDIDKIVWYDSDHPVPQGTLQALNGIFEHLPKAAEARKRLADAKDALFKSMSFTYYASGVLLRDEKGDPEFKLVPGAAGDSIFAVTPLAGRDNLKATSLTLAGAWQGGHAMVTPAVKSMPQGTILFASHP